MLFQFSFLFFSNLEIVLCVFWQKVILLSYLSSLSGLGEDQESYALFIIKSVDCIKFVERAVPPFFRGRTAFFILQR